MRIESELARIDDGQSRLGKSKDRIDHWTAKSGEAISTDQKNGDDQCTMNGEMRTEAATNNNGDEVAAGPEEFDISGSPAKEPEKNIVLT